MNGGHDLGGMHGFGPVEIERDEPVFHHEWERRAFAITVATGFLGKWNIDQSRFAREQMPPPEYLATTYYEHWLFGLERSPPACSAVAEKLGPSPMRGCSRSKTSSRPCGRAGRRRPTRRSPRAIGWVIA
jgi:nitrile hydratase